MVQTFISIRQHTCAGLQVFEPRTQRLAMGSEPLLLQEQFKKKKEVFIQLYCSLFNLIKLVNHPKYTFQFLCVELSLKYHIISITQKTVVTGSHFETFLPLAPC